MKLSFEVNEKHFLFLVGLLAVVSAVGIVTGQTAPNPGHSPGEIGPGTFGSGDYVFPGNLNVGNDIITGNDVFATGNKQNPAPGSCVTYPVEIKETMNTHNGNFGGYAEMQDWIEANGCEGYHVCNGWELVYAFSQLHDSVLCGDGSCSGWYVIGGGKQDYYSSTGYYMHEECKGWTSSTGTGSGSFRGPRWVDYYPHYAACSSSVNVLCCK